MSIARWTDAWARLIGFVLCLASSIASLWLYFYNLIPLSAPITFTLLAVGMAIVVSGAARQEEEAEEGTPLDEA